MFKLESDAEAPTLRQMNMPGISILNGTTSTPELTDVYLSAFLDLSINWNSSVTE
jgi:hypothetical protein